MKKILCVLLLFVIGCTPKTTMIEIQKHVYVEKEFKDSWLEMNEFGDSYIKEELQGGYGYSYDDQYLEIFFNSGGKIELYNYSIKKDNLIISGEMIPPATIRLVHPHLENVTSEGVIIHELGHYFDEKYHFSSSKQFIKLYKENKMKAVITDTEVMGNENNLYFQFGGCQAVARVSKYEISQVGDEIEFVFMPSKIHFFDKETELTICN